MTQDEHIWPESFSEWSRWAFRELVMTLSRSWDFHDVEEAVSEAILVVCEKCDELSFANYWKFRAYLKLAAERKLKDMKRKRRPGLLGNRVWEVPASVMALGEDPTPSLIQKFFSCFRKLKERSLELIRVHHCEGLTFTAAARRVWPQLSPSAAATRAARLKADLRKCLAQNGVEPKTGALHLNGPEYLIALKEACKAAFGD